MEPTVTFNDAPTAEQRAEKWADQLGDVRGTLGNIAFYAGLAIKYPNIHDHKNDLAKIIEVANRALERTGK